MNAATRCSSSVSSPVPVGSTFSISTRLRASGLVPPNGRMFSSGRSIMSSMFLRSAMPSTYTTAMRTPPGAHSRTTKSPFSGA